MNDDHDLERRLRAGAQAFPPAPTPDRAHLRHVLTTSRRRSRRTQGGVLVCATAAVAGGALLALREPRPTETLEVAAPGTTAPTETSDPTTSTVLPLPEAWSLCEPNFLDDPPPLLPRDEDTIARAHLFDVATRDGGPLPGDFAVAVDGRIIYSADPDHQYGSPPPDDRSSVIMFDHPLDGPGRLTMIRMPFDPSAREIAITAGGQTAVLGDLVDGVAPDPGLDAVQVSFGQFESVCAKAPPGVASTTVTNPPTTATVPPITVLPPTTVEAPPTSVLPPTTVGPPTTVEWPPTTAPPTTEP